MVKQLEINVLCDSRFSGVISFTDIVGSKATLDSEDYSPEGFWGLTGGLQVTIEGYKTVFQSTDFHYLVKVTSFLIHSLYWAKGKFSDWFDRDDIYFNDVVLRSTEGNLVRLHKLDKSDLVFSYTSHQENYIGKRGDRFFDGLVLNIQEWVSQTNIALTEFFDVLIKIANENKSNQTSELMLDYYRLWKQASSN